MKVIPNFTAKWLPGSIDIMDNEQGGIRIQSNSGTLTEDQKNRTLKYLIDEGFIEIDNNEPVPVGSA